MGDYYYYCYYYYYYPCCLPILDLILQCFSHIVYLYIEQEADPMNKFVTARLYYVLVNRQQ